jgi:hypothetical protein
LAGCGGGAQGSVGSREAPAAKVDRFDAARGMALVRLQLRAGQRTAGSPQLRALAEQLVRRMPNGRLVRIRDSDPAHPLRNVVGSIPGRGKAIVVGAHYDVLAKPDGFLGANNGAAGSAIVLEAAHVLAHTRRPPGAPPIRFVLFDGEEPAQGLPEEQQDFYATGLRGSRADARAHAARTRAMLLLDYVANKGLRLPRERTGDARLWAEVRAAAGRVGVAPVFPDRDGPAITDDHTPYLRAGVPAVDFIDWGYRCGHLLCDTYDQLSPRAMDAVGETVVELLRTMR